MVNLQTRVTRKEVRELACDFKRELDADQPGVILDFSDVNEMDTAGRPRAQHVLRRLRERGANSEFEHGEAWLEDQIPQQVAA